MEAIVLAPTSAPQVQISSQNGQSNGDGETSFAPLLSKAMAKKDGGSSNAASTSASDTTASTTASTVASSGQSRDGMDIDSDIDSDASEQFDLFLDEEPGSLNEYSVFASIGNSNQVLPQQPLSDIKVLLAETLAAPLSQGAPVSLLDKAAPEIPITSVIPAAMAAQLKTPAAATSETLQIFPEIPARTTLQPNAPAAAMSKTLLVFPEIPAGSALQPNAPAAATSETLQIFPEIPTGSALQPKVPAAATSETLQIFPEVPARTTLQPNAPVITGNEAIQTLINIPETVIQTSSQGISVTAAAQSQELSLTLAQLQELIANNETKGVVLQQQPQNAITLNELAGLTSQNLNIQTPTTSQAASTVSETIEAATTASQFTVHADIPASNSPSTQAPALRQDIHNHSLDGKLIINDSQDNKEGGKQTDQRGNDNNSTGQQATQTLQAGAPSQGTPTAESALFSLPVQNSATTQQTAHSGNTITLPSGTMVAEQEILNQVVQRFQMTSRLQNSKINLKLHPAELGELKINLTIKEGTIKASVFAQNQHVQEIIERNMPKLKSVLEQQGFTIDEIIVSSKSETVGNYDLFGEQFSHPQSFTSSDNTHSSFSSFENVLDTSMTGSNSSETGLSVRA